jgi:16S rRNA C967 or C1407 C5-methylase (RsmB/RsmF family)
VNTLKTTPEDLMQKLISHGLPVETVPYVPFALKILKRSNFFTLPEFQAGLFEVQDAGSQGVADTVQAKPGDQVLDFCAGAGGKTLAIAPRLKGRGQIFLHDIRLEALAQAKKRLRRAGVQNAQIVHHDDTRRLSLLKGKMDWVLVDAPCSGTGTLRRNPDMKWKFSSEMLQRLVLEQQSIFTQALQYLSPTGRIVYATCSLLSEENDQQVQFFLDHLPVSCEGEFFRSSPFSGMDGFFAATFCRKL